MITPQNGIFAQGTHAHYFLEFDLRAGVLPEQALRSFRRLEDTDGIADCLKDLTRLALAQGDKKEAALNGKLLLEIYQVRGQEQEARKLEELLKTGKGR